jgi:hypothetical protein
MTNYSIHMDPLMNAMPNIFHETDLSEIFKNLDDQEYSDILKNGDSDGYCLRIWAESESSGPSD